MKKAFRILPAALLALGSQQVFAQAPALYNTISGTVWSDDNTSPNGIRDAGEAPIGGILVSLVHDRAGGLADTVVSTALSDSNGVFTLLNYEGTGSFYVNYAFPIAGFDVSVARAGSDELMNSAADPLTLGAVDNNTVSTPPFTITTNANLNTYGLGLQRFDNTVTYWVMKPVSPTLWNETFVLPVADVALGTMNKVTLFATDAVRHPSMGLENTGLGSTPGTVEANGRITFTPPTGTAFETNTLARKTASVAAFDGAIDYSGASGRMWYEAHSGAYISRDITNAGQLASYRGNSTATISIGANAISIASALGSGNMVATASTNSGAGVFVTYTYTAPVVLAARLLSFEAAAEGSGAALSWAHTTSEKATGFSVERSTDGRDFATIGFVAAEGGRQAADGTMAYTFRDAVPAPGRNFYRLKQTDASGRSLYSTVRTVNFGKGLAAQAAYPNPADAQVTVKGADAGSRIVLHDALGRVAISVNAEANGQTMLNTAALPAGLYSLSTLQDGVQQTARLVIQHK